MFESIKGFFGKVGSFLYSAPGKIYDFASNAVSGVWGTAKTIVQTVHQDAKDYVGGVKGITEKALGSAEKVIVHSEDKISDTISNVGKTVEGIAGSLSTPLVMGALAIGAFMFLKK